jgi:hypothetical protein
MASSCEHGTKAVQLNLCVCVEGGGISCLSEDLLASGVGLAALKTFLTGYGRRPYNDALLFSLSHLKDCENRSFSTDSSKSRLRSDQLNTRIYFALIIWPWALLYTADDLMYWAVRLFTDELHPTTNNRCRRLPIEDDAAASIPVPLEATASIHTQIKKKI